MSDENTGIDVLLLENRTFPPSDEFKRDTLVAGTFLYDEANEDYQGFWAKQAAELLTWSKEWDTICEWNLPVLQVVHRWAAERRRELPRPPRRRRQGRQGRDPLRRRAR